jgi:uncharacterized protein with HEPN domain
MPPSAREYLHILAEASYIMIAVKELSKDNFVNDETVKRAFVRSLEVIGEAAKQTPNELRQSHSQVEWRNIAGMRDRLIRSYFGVDFDVIWDVVINKIPPLAREIQKILDTDFPSNP